MTIVKSKRVANSGRNAYEVLHGTLNCAPLNIINSNSMFIFGGNT